VISRTYRYIYSDPVGDIQIMREVAPLFLGKNDYSCMARIEPGKSPLRTVTALTIHEDSGCCWLEITAPSFLWHMVRCIATVLNRASRNEITPDEVGILLTGRCKNKVRPASPEGLILWEIEDRTDWIPVPVLNRTIRLHQRGASLHRTMEMVHTLLLP
jgi:tRNA pseudouridine38-40 synthase